MTLTYLIFKMAAVDLLKNNMADTSGSHWPETHRCGLSDSYLSQTVAVQCACCVSDLDLLNFQNLAVNLFLIFAVAFQSWRGLRIF